MHFLPPWLRQLGGKRLDNIRINNSYVRGIVEVLFFTKSFFWGVKILVGLSDLSFKLKYTKFFGSRYVSLHTVCLINCEILHSHN